MILLSATLLMGGFSSASAESLDCKAGNFLSIQGDLQDGIFTAHVTMLAEGTLPFVDAQNLTYKKSDDPGHFFRLVEDDFSQSVKNDGKYFIPEFLDLTIGTRSLIHFFLPTKGDQGQPMHILITALLTCEKAPNS